MSDPAGYVDAMVERHGANRSSVLSAALEVACWWLVATGAWLLTLSTITSTELGVALASGLVSALAGRAGRRALGGSWRMRPSWLRWLLLLPWAVVADSARVLWVALRALGGYVPASRVRTISLAPHERESLVLGHQALATVVLSATPSTVVIDADPGPNTLAVHSLVSGVPEMGKVVTR